MQMFSMVDLRNFMLKDLFHNSTAVFHRYKDKDKVYEYDDSEDDICMCICDDDCEDDTYRVSFSDLDAVEMHCRHCWASRECI